MKTFICVAALFIVGAFAERCFKPDGKVGGQTFDEALKKCMGTKTEANKETYECMLDGLGVKGGSMEDMQKALAPHLKDAAAFKTLIAECKDQATYLDCVDKILSDKCTDDNDLVKGA